MTEDLRQQGDKEFMTSLNSLCIGLAENNLKDQHNCAKLGTMQEQAVEIFSIVKVLSEITDCI